MSAAVPSVVSGSAGAGASNIMKGITDFFATGNNKYLLFGVVFLVVLSATIYYVYQSNLSPELTKFFNQMKGQQVSTTSDTNTEDKTAILYLFKVDWCPHCKKAEPVFSDLEKQINGQKINDYSITFKVVDCEAEPAMADRFNVTGFPTIKLDKHGEIIEYDAKPDKENLLDFLKKVL
jgi:thiol-disulfide isomerase/thioredoxin